MIDLLGELALGALGALSAQWVVKYLRDRRATTNPQAPQPAADLQESAVPGDILLMAHTWRDAWAQQAVLGRARELYAATEDWDAVRQILALEHRAAILGDSTSTNGMS